MFLCLNGLHMCKYVPVVQCVSIYLSIHLGYDIVPKSFVGYYACFGGTSPLFLLILSASQS